MMQRKNQAKPTAAFCNKTHIECFWKATWFVYN